MADSPFVWHEVYTRDGEATKSFYSSLFGWATEGFDMGDATYTMFKGDGDPFAGMYPMSGPEFENVSPH